MTSMRGEREGFSVTGIIQLVIVSMYIVRKSKCKGVVGCEVSGGRRETSPVHPLPTRIDSLK